MHTIHNNQAEKHNIMDIQKEISDSISGGIATLFQEISSSVEIISVG